jgi:hypothetical protein
MFSNITASTSHKYCDVAQNIPLFFGALAKLQKATVSFVTSVCSSVRMEKLGSHWADFNEI